MKLTCFVFNLKQKKQVLALLLFEDLGFLPLVGEIQRLSTRSSTLRSTICIKCVHALSMLSVFIYVYWCLTGFLYHMMFVSTTATYKTSNTFLPPTEHTSSHQRLARFVSINL
jgi:hypothetical protein